MTAFDHDRDESEQHMCVSAELGTRRYNCSILLLALLTFFFLFFIFGVLLRLIDDLVNVFFTLAPHEEVDVHHSEEVKDPGHNLEGKVQCSVTLPLGAGGTISDEAAKECYEHDDKAKEDIDAQSVVQPGDVGTNEGGCKHDELSQPLDNVERGSKTDENLVHSSRVLRCHTRLANPQPTNICVLVYAINCEE